MSRDSTAEERVVTTTGRARRRRLHPGPALVLTACLAALGCQAQQQPAAAHSEVTTSQTTTTPVTPAGTPSPTEVPARQRVATVTRVPTGETYLPGGVVLPDRSRTPGATNSAVTQADIRSTICRTGYTETLRPPSDYTTDLKRQQLASGYAYRGDTSTSDYEEDHLIPLELGGAASDARNLWPEPYAAAEGARVKDGLENKLHDLVCSGALSLRTAQHAIATNWWAAYQTYGGEAAPEIWYGSYSGTSGSATASTSNSPAGATAQCNDGTYSYSRHRSGTCSHHGGVARWITPPPS
jgi:hypothetical protein